MVKTIQDAMSLFVNDDGSVKVEYALVDGSYVEKGTPEVRTQAYMGNALVYPHHAAMEGKMDMAAFRPVHEVTAYTPIKIAAYSFNNLTDQTNGGFYKSIDSNKKELVDQAFGLFSLQPLVWLSQKHPDRLVHSGISIEELREFAIKTDDYLKTLWSEDYGIYADVITADGTPNFNHPKYDLRTIGYLMWGHSLLHNLIHPVDNSRAEDIANRAKTFFDHVIVDNVTVKADAGIPRLL